MARRISADAAPPPSEGDVPPLPYTRKLPVPVILALLLAATDQAAKAWTVRNLLLYEVQTVIPGWFDLVHVRNPGVAFSLLAGLDPQWVRPALLAVTVLAIGGLLYFLRFLPEKGSSLWGLGLILGGAAGNLIDRVRFGFVVDFIDLYRGSFHWPTFNVADIGISVGVLLLVADMLFGEKESDASRPAADR
jgi:signal peptidase II